MTINYLAIIIATVISFALGSVWFSKLFGKAWMKIHHADAKSAGDIKMSMKNMWKFMLTEFLLTLVINLFLYLAIIKSFSLRFTLATVFLLWLGFILPTTTSSVLWGNDDKKYMARKILISSTYRLVAMLISAWIFFMWR
ncbi:DUF1761 domain-containing protein [Candidatus Parcubacteria bacterium]|nr:DUF1761 domain-containing protein [Candidatus Parcubacteria bacterium]